MGARAGWEEGGFYGRSRFEKACRQKISTLFFQNIIFLFFPRAALARAEIVFQNFSQKFFKDSTRRRSAINLVRNKLKSIAGKSLLRTRFIAPNLSSSSQQPMRARARSSSQQQREIIQVYVYLYYYVFMVDPAYCARN
jgi:hypothetical protein